MFDRLNDVKPKVTQSNKKNVSNENLLFINLKLEVYEESTHNTFVLVVSEHSSNACSVKDN